MKKLCTCGLWSKPGKDARYFVDPQGAMTGVYWNCFCGSTLFRPQRTETVIKALKALGWKLGIERREPKGSRYE